jgi:hypothetical protein
MPNIKDIRKSEMEQIIDFWNHIQEYGHIFYGDNQELEEPFKKILEGIEEVRKIQDKYWSH